MTPETLTIAAAAVRLYAESHPRANRSLTEEISPEPVLAAKHAS